MSRDAELLCVVRCCGAVKVRWIGGCAVLVVPIGRRWAIKRSVESRLSQWEEGTQRGNRPWRPWGARRTQGMVPSAYVPT